MAKPEASASRQRSALLDLAPGDEDDDAFLRPAVTAAPAGGSRRTRSGKPDPGEDAEAFLRARRRVHPRNGRLRTLLSSRFGRVLLSVAGVLALAASGAAVWAVHAFLEHDPHFRIDGASAIEAAGNTELSRTEIVNVFGTDIGRNIFFVPLARRESALEALPWVRHATVMRLLPRTLRVTIDERVPVAFVRVGREVELVDGEGVLLTMPPATLAARHYSFPVVTGLDPNSPPEARAERMRLYSSFVAALDSGGLDDGRKVSEQLSEVDLSDLHDVRAVVPAQGTDMLLHFGDSDFLERYRSYREHLAEWRQQYPNLSAVDLRYDRQVVLKMADAAQADEAEETKPPVISPAEQGPESLRKHHAVLPAAPPHHAAAAGGPAAKHAAAAKGHAGAHVWYTEKRAGTHADGQAAVRWVPHYAAGAGRPQ